MAIWVIHSSVPLESTALMNFYFYPICKFTDRAVYLDILSLLCPTYIYIFGHKGSGTINAWEEERHQRWGVYYKWRCSLVCRTCHFPGRYSSEVKEFTNLKCWMISESPYDFSHRLRWRVGCWWFLSDLCTLTHLTLQRAVPVYCIQEGPGI